MNNLGYNQPLFILPFDHRSSFIKIFGKDINKIKNLKQIIYASFRDAVSNLIAKENAAILVDEEFGDEILKDALKRGFITLLPTEKSGQKEFKFEYGNGFGEHIEKYKPNFVKALIRYNPNTGLEKNKRQQEKLKILSHWCHNNTYKFLLEILINPPQNSPKLLLKSIEQLQKAGIEPDVWKIEGMDNPDFYKDIVQKVRSEGRINVGIVILGRGENKEKVEKWILAGKNINGIIGFAIGRTIFLKPLLDYSGKAITKEEAIRQISNNYQHFYKIFTNNQ